METCRKNATRKKGQKNDCYLANVPDHEIEALARCLFPEIQKYFESEEGQREFQEWKQKQVHEEEP